MRPSLWGILKTIYYKQTTMACSTVSIWPVCQEAEDVSCLYFPEHCRKSKNSHGFLINFMFSLLRFRSPCSPSVFSGWNFCRRVWRTAPPRLSHLAAPIRGLWTSQGTVTQHQVDGSLAQPQVNKVLGLSSGRRGIYLVLTGWAVTQPKIGGHSWSPMITGHSRSLRKMGHRSAPVGGSDPAQGKRSIHWSQVDEHSQSIR